MNPETLTIFLSNGLLTIDDHRSGYGSWSVDALGESFGPVLIGFSDSLVIGDKRVSVLREAGFKDAPEKVVIYAKLVDSIMVTLDEGMPSEVCYLVDAESGALELTT